MTSSKYSLPYWPLEKVMQTGSQCVTIAVEGNISAGKSTLLSSLEQLGNYEVSYGEGKFRNRSFKPPSLEVLHEPVGSWTDFEGYNILELSYKQPLRWAFTFEAKVFFDLAKLHRQPSTKPIKAMEISIYAARNCYTENLNNTNLLNAAEYKILDDLFQISTDKGSCQVDLFVYLRTEPSKCMERLQARNRPEEITVDLTYLSNLHNLHEQWFCPSEKNVQEGVIPSVVVIDGNRTKEEVFEDAKAQIQHFLDSRGMA